MNYDNYSDEGSALNSVNITSNVRAPGEYKYYYCGENNSGSDKSFLAFSTMWHTQKITEDMILLSSCYTSSYTCLLYFHSKKTFYYIYVYQNILDYKSENISLKAIQLIHLEHSIKKREIDLITETNQPVLNKIVKVYFGADNYLLLNEIDRRILLLDFINGNYVTIFINKDAKTQEPLYNIIDTYDENYYLEGESRVRTYAFLSIKNQEKKVSKYKYRYFIIERGILETNNFFLHSLEFKTDDDNEGLKSPYMDDSEPISVKIAKIPKQTGFKKDAIGSKSSQWFYIFCFMSKKKLFVLVTNYDKLSLYQILRTINQYIIPFKGVRNKFQVITMIGARKDNRAKQTEEDKINEEKNVGNNNNTETNNNNNFEKNDSNENNNNTNANSNSKNNKILFWLTETTFWEEEKQMAQGFDIFLNINTKQLCALILFFENGAIASFPFNYSDSPEVIKNKITVNREIQIDKIKSNNKQDKIKIEFGPYAKVVQFQENYVFKSNTVCALSSKNLIIAIHNKLHIYNSSTSEKLFSYDFFEENIATFLLFEDIGYIFLLTWNKIFKIIFTTRFRVWAQNEIINNPKCPVGTYQQEGMSYPLFDFSPEDVWNSYCSKFDIDSNNNKNVSNNTPKVSINPINNKVNSNDEQKKNKVCVICSKDAEYYCSDCELRYYCCNEHFLYDYNIIHFFECQLVQFFRRKDIMSIENKEIRYIVLYNELIKFCGRILNFIFTRIFGGKDYHIFLEMLLTLIELLDNFGFNINLSEFCCCNLINPNNKFKQKPEKILFYQECIYFYVHLQMLKCTFASKCKLYNLSDCYMKIIKNDVIPKLSPKDKRKLTSLKCERLNKNSIFKNEFYLNFQSPVFFDLKKVFIDTENSDNIDIVELYIMKHLMTLSLLVKFKIKLHSSIDVRDTFTDIPSMFEDHFRDKTALKNVIPYCYFSLSFYLVEIGKVPNAVKLLRRMESTLNEKSDNKLKALTYYNLGVLQYALGEFKIGIHNIEIAYKKIVEFFLSEKFKYRVIVTLGLAYLNQRNLFKAYVLIQTSISELKKIRKQKYELKCIKLNVYLNYIIDLYEYTFITKARLQTNKTKIDKNYNIFQLINFVKCSDDKELIVIEQHVNEFLKVVEYVWNLPDDVLQTLQKDNPPKITNNKNEEIHEKNISFTMEQSQMSTFIVKDTGTEKEESQEEYDEDIDVKPTLFDSLTRQQQKDFKELKTVFLKRDIILRDSLGTIEKFNINYDPLYSVQFQKIIEKLKNNFLLKEIFYCFQNEKWRDELYNYSPNNVLFGLSKYLKLEKIKNIIAIEKSKCLDIIKKEKTDLSKDQKSIRQSLLESDLLKKINIENNMYPNSSLQILASSENQNNIIQNNNSSLFSRYKNEDMNYVQFKKKFYEALKEKEKNKNDSFQSVNLKDDYLISLYKNVYLNNPDHDFIFQNPSLILNYIFIDISNSDNYKKEANELILKQKAEEESNLNKSKIRKSNSLISNKYINSTHIIKEEVSNSKLSNNKVPSTFKNANSNLNWHKESNDNYNRSNPELKRSNNYFNLKYDIEEDNLKICRKVSEVSYYFIRKKTRSATSSYAGRFFPSFGKKKKPNERRSILPDLFLKFNEKNESSKKKLSAGTANDNYKEVVIKNKPIINNKRLSGIIKFPEKIQKKNRKKSIFDSNQSCKHLHDRLSMNFLLYHKDLDEKEKPKDNNSNEEIKDNNIFEEKKDEDNNNNKEDLKIEQKKENQHIDENIFKKSSKRNRVSILNINSERENKNEINNINEKNNNIENIKDNILKKEEEEFKILNINQNNQGLIKNSRTKVNKKNEFPKHNSMKEFNHANLLLTTNIINRIATKKNKNLMISTKKTLAKPKTYNYFSPEQIQNEEEDIDYNENKKIVYSLSQKKLKNNYGYKNKEEQENEVIQGAINYLQNEYNNKNKKNKYTKENSILNNRVISMGTIQNKYKINENNNSSNRNKFNYKIPYDYKSKGKQFGEESEMSLNSTSSGFILNNVSSYGGSSYMDRSSESNMFQKEMRRIINFNKKLKSNGKSNNNQLNNNQNKNKMKKSSSQPNFFDKKNLGISRNAEKYMYNKENQISKTNKNFSLLSNISKRNLNKPNNVTSSISRNCCLNNNQINSFKNNINNNNKKFNVKSTQNRKSNIAKPKSNKENNKVNYVDYYEDEQKYFQKNNENSNDYNYECKNENNDNENSKYRFVLDKYIKKQKKRSPKHQIDEEKNRNIIKENKSRENLEENKIMESNAKVDKENEDNLENNVEKEISIRKDEKNFDKKISNDNQINNEEGENSDIFSSKRDSKIKENNNNEKSKDKDNDSFFNEGINFEKLCDNNINEIKSDNNKVNEYGNNYNDNNEDNNIDNKDNINDNNFHKDNIYDNNDNNNDYNDNNVYINTNDNKDNINNINDNIINNNDNINENNENDNNNINNNDYKNNNINNNDYKINNDYKNNNEYINTKGNINDNNINNDTNNYENIKIDEQTKKITNESQNSSLNNNIKNSNTSDNKLSLNNKSNNSSKNSNSILKQNTNENKYYNSSKDTSSCNELGEDMNIQGKINLPSFAPPIIRRISQQNIYNNKNSNENKNENNNNNNYIIKSNNSNEILNNKNFSNGSKKSSISSHSNNKGNMENNQEHSERNDINIFGNIINQKYERPNFKKK